MEKQKLEEILEKSKNISDVARLIFNNCDYRHREKSKEILAKNGINWEEWSKIKKLKPKKYCLYCGKEIIGGDYRKIFCNNSCSAYYHSKNNLYERKKTNKAHCLVCGKELKKKGNKYCSLKCKSEYEHKQYIERWKNGEESGMSGPEGISSHIRRYFLDKYNNKCQICNWGEINPWTNKVPLQIHHIDGDCTNNNEENLQLLCPNCHSLTETFGSVGRHKSKRVDRRTKYYNKEIAEDKSKNIEDVSRCIVCGKKLTETQTTFCSLKCLNRYRAKNITKEEILEEFHKNKNCSYAKIASIFGISATSLIRKCTNFGIKDEIQKLRFDA